MSDYNDDNDNETEDDDLENEGENDSDELDNEPKQLPELLAGMTRMTLQELKEKKPTELLQIAEALDIENAATMRKQGIMFAVLKEVAERGVEISGGGTLEILQDGFGFLRSPEANYLAGPDDIYVSPNQIKKFGLRTGDTVEGAIRAPRRGERYFALLKIGLINFVDPEAARHKIHFDNLTPLYPEERFNLELRTQPSRTTRPG
jgi:transcription termination factor Rho